MIFPSYNVKFTRSAYEEAIIVTGEIKNEMLKDYRVAMFRVILYSKYMTLGSGVIKIHDFKRKATRAFSVSVDIHRNLLPSIVRHEILFETGY